MKHLTLCLGLALALASCSRTGFIDSDGETGVRDVGGEGGEVKAPGALLSVPAHALASTVRVTITRANDGNPTENVGDAFELGPSGTTFSEAVTLTLKVDPAALPDPAHPELARVAVVQDGDWVALEESAFDAASNTVSGKTTHFSRYGIIQICGNFRSCPAGSVCVRHRCRPVEQCDNGLDDDRDGLRDCADPDCAGAVACTTRCCFDTIANACVSSCCQNGVCLGNCYCGSGWCSRCAGGGTETQCADGLDNDNDGFADCRDPDCAGSNACQTPVEVCNNGLDDDRDGQVDCADSDCASDPVACPSCCFVTIGSSCVPSCCQNGVCQGNCFCSPQVCGRCSGDGGTSKPEDCTNGVDDDLDGLVDCRDPDCLTSLSCLPPPTEMNCSDGIDNDRDGLVDCRDADCMSSGACTCNGADAGNPGCCYPVCGSNEVLTCLGGNICSYPCTCQPKAVDAGSAKQWYRTCGDPVCHGHTITGVRPCLGNESAGVACGAQGDRCDMGDQCNVLLQCDTMDPTHGGNCPISRASFKQDITYLDQKDLERYHDELMTLPLATYTYKDALAGERPHLGFIIDENEGLICVQPVKNTVDVYGYASMAVAALKVQAQQIERLEAQLKALEARLAAPRR